MIAAIHTALFACILAFDFRLNLKGAKVGEKVVYLTILIIGYALTMAVCLGIQIPSPAYPIQNAVRAIFGVRP